MARLEQQNIRTPSPTAVLEARVDIRLLARLAEGLVAEGYRFNSKSEMIRQSLMLLHDVLVQNGLIERFETITSPEALTVLADFGLEGMNRGGRNVPILNKRISYERALVQANTFPTTVIPQDTVVISAAKWCLQHEGFLPLETWAMLEDIERRQGYQFDWLYGVERPEGIPCPPLETETSTSELSKKEQKTYDEMRKVVAAKKQPSAMLWYEFMPIAEKTGGRPEWFPQPLWGLFVEKRGTEQSCYTEIIDPSLEAAPPHVRLGYDGVACDKLTPERIAAQQASDIEQARKMREFSEKLVEQRKASETTTKEES